MYQVQDGYSQYKEIDLAARTAAASPLELVLVLFSGLMDELERAKSHIEGRRFEKKAQSINKCIDILNALTSSLEFETGGELVVNLSRLYDHCVYRSFYWENRVWRSQPARWRKIPKTYTNTQ